MYYLFKPTVQDANEIKELLTEIWYDTYRELLKPEEIRVATDVWFNLELLQKQLADPQILFITAKDEQGEIVGITTTKLFDEETFNLSRLYVHPACQGQGLGLRLWEAVLTQYPDCNICRLGVIVGNQKAISFYLKSGFVEVERIKETAGELAIDVMVMEKKLR
jgi:ribosomal protein S18 acetylase RimI-like enzyme